jgi:hypothetical protein
MASRKGPFLLQGPSGRKNARNRTLDLNGAHNTIYCDFQNLLVEKVKNNHLIFNIDSCWQNMSLKISKKLEFLN